MKIQEKACGCIIIKDEKILLIRQMSGAWGFPKGHVEHDETEVETAIREVKEETNIDVEVDESKRYTMQYFTDKGIGKEVVIFLAKPISNDLKIQENEIIEAKWMSYSDALATVSYDNTRELLLHALTENKLYR
ncbi:MAG: NUDIX domain-containing protein [Clostridia bacterium]|nr:NUDIX domain-containing protein [Clostridia bacterium]